MRALIAALCCITLMATPAQARWRKAESEHFIIYADDSARDLARFGNMLERFHKALEFLTGKTTETPSPSNRVTIYAVGGSSDMQRLAGSREIAGFYSARAGGSVAFVQDAHPTTREPPFSVVVLLHEYAHYFASISSRFPQPPWMSEGGAEFFASARFPSDGGVEIGRPAMHRAGDLFYAADVPIRELLDADLYAQRTSTRHDAFYGRAWLLFHYLSLSNERPGQFSAYTTALSEGMSAMAAAEQAFGDLDQLESDLDDYLHQRRMMMLTLRPTMVTPGAVYVSELSDGMDEVLPLQIISKRGVSHEDALELLPKVRAIAASYPDDAGVLAALAEAELDAGNDAEALAAANRAIAADPSVVNAYVQKGYALFNLAADASMDEREEAYSKAMEPFSALNAREPDHPLPLIYYYRSLQKRGKEPTELARQALERASELAPFDRSLALEVATMVASQGKIALARALAAPLAFDPHGGKLGKLAQFFMNATKNAEEAEPFNWTPPLIIDPPEVEPEPA
tara:strand:+ start:10149 stop:11693 length:1545 start_codon:yes stop_codon:yes gene_type:complete